jgi:peptidoglycan hydrolase CwlO-like protein
MFAKLFALLLLAATLYGVGIFATPKLADTYGNKEWNTKIREYKKSFENFSSGWLTPKSLMESAQDIAKPYIDESQKTIQEVQNTAKEIKTTIDTKTEQVSQAIDSTQKALDGVNKAKEDIQNTLRFSSGSR